MTDEEVMGECINYASSFAGFTKSNPLVAAAAVDKDNNIITVTAHKIFGDNHAEKNLIEIMGRDIKGSKVFITMEPCSSYGKTPPCVDSLIGAEVSEVVIALLDPNPLNYEHGVKKLIDAGIKVKLGVSADKAAELIKPFIKSQISDYPFITTKIAMSLDGAIATRSAISQWITSSSSRNAVHRLRAKTDAIISGIGTVINDDPMFNSRIDNPMRQPVRVILDSKLKIPHQSKIVKSAKEFKTIIFTLDNIDDSRVKKTEDFGIDVYKIPADKKGMIDIKKVLIQLKSLDIINVLLEAGSTLIGSFNDEKLIDKFIFFIAPIIIGGKDSMHSIGGLGIDTLKDIKDLSSFNIDKSDRDLIVNADVYNYTNDIISKTFKLRNELCLQG